MVASVNRPRPAKLVIFVDSNVLLELYQHFDPKIRQLPAKLTDAADSLLITRQVADEVQRGKLRVAREGVRRALATLKAPPCALPVGLHPFAEALRANVDALESTISEIRNAAHEHLGRVARSEDSVSKALAPILAKAVAPSGTALERARLRRERGNPPGKPGDPLGDQLSWEQLLEHAQDAEGLWLVTGDGDFATGTGKGEDPYRLNPLLYEELQIAAPNVLLKIFGKAPRDLVQALNDYFAARGEAEKRFTGEQIAYFEHLAEQADAAREPWECRRDGTNTPIEYATCVACDLEYEEACGEEDYIVRHVSGGFELEFTSDTGGTIAECEECGGTVFMMEFRSLCSYCQHVFDSD